MAYEANDIIARMVQPDSLKSEDYQPWSRGRGIDVWAMICASISGDLETIKMLVTRDPNLVNCAYEYFTPIRFCKAAAVEPDLQAARKHLMFLSL